MSGETILVADDEIAWVDLHAAAVDRNAEPPAPRRPTGSDTAAAHREATIAKIGDVAHVAVDDDRRHAALARNTNEVAAPDCGVGCRARVDDDAGTTPHMRERLARRHALLGPDFDRERRRHEGAAREKRLHHRQHALMSLLIAYHRRRDIVPEGELVRSHEMHRSVVS